MAKEPTNTQTLHMIKDMLNQRAQPLAQPQATNASVSSSADDSLRKTLGEVAEDVQQLQGEMELVTEGQPSSAAFDHRRAISRVSEKLRLLWLKVGKYLPGEGGNIVDGKTTDVGTGMTGQVGGGNP